MLAMVTYVCDMYMYCVFDESVWVLCSVFYWSRHPLITSASCWLACVRTRTLYRHVHAYLTSLIGQHRWCIISHQCVHVQYNVHVRLQKMTVHVPAHVCIVEWLQRCWSRWNSRRCDWPRCIVKPSDTWSSSWQLHTASCRRSRSAHVRILTMYMYM